MRRISLGANDNCYADWVRNAPSPNGMNCERRYFDGINRIPVDYSSMKMQTQQAIVSLRLVPDDLLQHKTVKDNGSGKTTLRDQLVHLIGTLPSGVWLTMWHEACPGNNLDYPEYIEPHYLKAAHRYVQYLCRSNPNADGGRTRYCQIIIGAAWPMRHWIAPDLDGYGIDIYDNRRYWSIVGHLSKRKLLARLDSDRAALRVISGHDPVMHFPETNSPKDKHRRKWFRVLAVWMTENRGGMLISHWHMGGSDSGPWPPTHKVLRELRRLQRRYGA